MKTFLSLLFTLLASSAYAQSKNETAIRQLLEKESATWRSGDVKAHADCWFIRPYSKILISTLDGKMLDIPPDVMINPPPGAMGKGGSSVNSDYKMSVSKKTAWVSHREVSTAPDGVKSYSYEIRMLEKIKGRWKLVGQSIHAYKP